MTARDIVVAGALPRHQMRKYFDAHEILRGEKPGPDGTTVFTIYYATEAQWGQIQEWVRKVTR